MSISVIILVLTWVLVQALKTAKVPSDYLPITALVVGVVLSIAISLFTGDANLINDIVVGAISGFSATGANETATKSISAIIDSIGASITKTK